MHTKELKIELIAYYRSSVNKALKSTISLYATKKKVIF